MSIAKNTRKQRNKQKMTYRESLIKLNTVLPYNPAIIHLDIYLTDLKTFALHTNVYGNFIHGPPNWELQWCPSLVNGSRTVGAVHNGILFSDKKRNELSRHTKMWMNLKCSFLCRKNYSGKLKLCDSIFMISSKGTIIDGAKKPEVLFRREKELNRWSPGDVLGQWNNCVWYCSGIYTFAKTIELHGTKANLHVCNF